MAPALTGRGLPSSSQRTCVYVAHGGLFVVAVDEQHLIICWLGLEVLNILSSFVKLSLNVGGTGKAYIELGNGERQRERQHS